MPTATQPRIGARVATAAGYGTTPRVPLTGFSVLGILTFWAYVAARLALLVQEHMRRRWQEVGAALEQGGASPEQIERWRREGFDTRIAVPVAAAVLYAISGVIIVGWCVRWFLLSGHLDAEFLEYGVIMLGVSFSAAVFYTATCLLVLWVARRIHAHEVSELAIRERGAEIAVTEEIVPDEAMVTRWEQINNHAALFLILSFAMIGSPVVVAHLFLSGATSAYAGIPALICFILGGVFHFWGTRLLLGLFNSHLAFEAAHRAGSVTGNSRSSKEPKPAQPNAAALDTNGALEPYAGTESFIFVSYKRDDFPRIRDALERVRDAGYHLWYDKGIPGGADWDALIEEKLKGCSMMLFFVSRGSVDSKYCRREVKYVDQLGKPILSVKLEPAELGHGLEMLLTQYQMVDASNQDFTGEIERSLKYLRLL